MEGWVKIWRKILDHEFYKERRIFSHYEAFLDLILLASHTDREFLLGTQLIKMRRSELVTSEVKLMDRWRWSKAKVRWFLNILQKDRTIDRRADHKKTIISVLNYSAYQDSQTTKEPPNEPVNAPQKDTIKKNKKKEGKKKSISALAASFEIFYKAYPKRRARRNAEKAWGKLNPSEDLQEKILKCIEVQKGTEDWKEEGGRFIPYPASFLNAHRWEDEMSPKDAEAERLREKYAGIGETVDSDGPPAPARPEENFVSCPKCRKKATLEELKENSGYCRDCFPRMDPKVAAQRFKEFGDSLPGRLDPGSVSPESKGGVELAD